MARLTLEQMMIPPNDFVPVIESSALAANVDLPADCRGLYNGGTTQNVEVVMENGNTRAIPLTGGVITPGQFRRINAAGSASARTIFAIT